MMMRALRLFSSEVRGIHTAAYVLAGSAIISSLLAFLRDRLLAYTFGAGQTLDIYYAAFRLPDLIFVVAASVVSAYVLIPELVVRQERDQREYLDTVFFWFSVFMITACAIAAYFAPYFLRTTFTQLADAGSLDELVGLTRILLLQPILLGCSSILAAISQARHRYILYASTPLVYNFGIIFGVLFLYPLVGLPGIAWGVVLGAALHFGIQLPAALTDGFFGKISRVGSPRILTGMVAVSVPRSLALSMNQISFLGLLALAGALATGSISIFMLAFNLQAAPLAIIGASYSVAAFPLLAQVFSRGELSEFLEQVSTAARHIFFWSFPAIALLIVLRAHIVRAVLGTGAFDWTDTRLTAAAFAVFVVSLSAQALMLLLVRGYYAAGRTFVPFVMSALSAAICIGLGYAFIHIFDDRYVLSIVEDLLRVSGVEGSSVLALALAYSVSSVITSCALVIHFERSFPGFISRVRRTFSESIIAALCAGIVAYTALNALGDISPASTFISTALHAALSGVVGILATIVAYAVIGNREFNETTATFRRRFFFAPKPIVSAEDVAQ